MGDNLEVELALFSFKLSNGGEELRGAAFAYAPSLTKNWLFSFWSRMKCKTNLIHVHVCSHNCIREFLCREGTHSHGMMEQFQMMKYGLSQVVTKVVAILR